MPLLSPITNSHPTGPIRRAFTLIEILVVIAIIVILASILIAVGLSVKANAAIRSTHATLKTLEGVMSDYLKEGNPEPIDTKDPNAQTVWVSIFRANPNYAKKIASLPTATSGTNVTLLDSFGSPIRYIPYNSLFNDANNGMQTSKREGYFQSAGPDRTIGNTDDLYSYDP